MAGDSYSSQFPAASPVGIDHENWIAAFLGASICGLEFLAVAVQKISHVLSLYRSELEQAKSVFGGLDRWTLAGRYLSFILSFPISEIHRFLSSSQPSSDRWVL